MATSNAEPRRSDRTRVAWGLLAGVPVVLGVVLLASWHSTPQMGTDEEVFHTVDALFTAITSHDEKRLADCEQQLKAHREAGKLPPDAANTLDGIIAKARAGSWETAAERLYDFMKAQRRDGATTSSPKKPKSPKGAR